MFSVIWCFLWGGTRYPNADDSAQPGRAASRKFGANMSANQTTPEAILLLCGGFDYGVNLTESERQRLIAAAIEGRTEVRGDDPDAETFDHVVVVLLEGTQRPYAVVYESVLEGAMMFLFLDTPSGVVEGVMSRCEVGVQLAAPEELEYGWRLLRYAKKYVLAAPWSVPYPDVHDRLGYGTGLFGLTQVQAARLGWPFWELHPSEAVTD